MIYTLQHGLQRTTSEKLWRGLQYAVVGAGFGAVLLFVGNVWYAALYNPRTNTGASSPQTTGTVVQITPASVNQPSGADATNSVVPVTNDASGSASVTVPRPRNTATASTQLTQVADSTPVGGMGGGPVDTAPVTSTDPITVPTAGDGGTVTVDPPAPTGTGDGTSGGTDSGGTGVDVPPIAVTIPVVDTPIVTPDIDLSLSAASPQP